MKLHCLFAEKTKQKQKQREGKYNIKQIVWDCNKEVVVAAETCLYDVPLPWANGDKAWEQMATTTIVLGPIDYRLSLKSSHSNLA